MVKFVVVLLALGAILFSSGCKGANSQLAESLTFFLDVDGGPKSCLIALRHLAKIPMAESDTVVNCERQAKALVLEANPTLEGVPFWSNYKRRTDDPDVSKFSDATRNKIFAALNAAKYSQKEIDYFFTLHPIAIYRALMFSKVMAPSMELLPNLDVQLGFAAKLKNFKIIEMEGMSAFFHSERQLDIEKIDFLVSAMCDVLLQPERFFEYSREADFYASASDYEDVDSGWRNKFRFNTVALGLPSYSVWHDVDSRNQTIVDGMMKAMSANEPLLIFIGSAHIGGPNGVLKILSEKGVRITRVP